MGVLNPNNQYKIYWIKYNRPSKNSFIPHVILKLNLLIFLQELSNQFFPNRGSHCQDQEKLLHGLEWLCGTILEW